MGQGLQNHALANGEMIARMKGTVMSTFPQALAVLYQEVVVIETNSADGWMLVEAGVSLCQLKPPSKRGLFTTRGQALTAAAI